MIKDKDKITKAISMVLDLISVVLGMVLTLEANRVLLPQGMVLKEPWLMIVAYSAITMLFLIIFRAYDNPIQDYSALDVFKLVSALFVSCLVSYLLMFLMGTPIAAITLLDLMTFPLYFCGLYRLLLFLFLRHGKDFLNLERDKDMKRVIIVGAGAAGKYLADMLLFDHSKKMRPVAFIDDNLKLEGKNIKGLKVVGPRALIPYAANRYNAEEIILAIPFVSNTTIREIFNLCCEAGCKVKRFGNMSAMVFEGLSKATINEVRVEDLLGRAEVKLDLDSVSKLIKGKTVLVTGGAGSIGSELCRQTLHYGAELVVVFDFCENSLFEINGELGQKYSRERFVVCLGSIRDRTRLKEVFKKYQPEIVFHAAAHKHVPMMEINPREAVINNIIGTLNVAETAITYKAERFIQISTDKAVNPTNVMGATKRVAELLVQRANGQGTTLFTAVRFGNVLGSNGSVVKTFQRQIQKGGPLTVTHKEIERYFMTIPEAVQLVLESGSIAEGGEIFVLDMGEPIKIYDLAVTMIKLSGLEPEKDIKIEITGLRPGEKLSEELSLMEESVSKTANNRIFVMKVPEQQEKEQFEENFRLLHEMIEQNEFSLVYHQLKKIVPSFPN